MRRLTFRRNQTQNQAKYSKILSCTHGNVVYEGRVKEDVPAGPRKFHHVGSCRSPPPPLEPRGQTTPPMPQLALQWYNPEPLSQSNACSENPSSLRQKLCFPLLPHTASNSPRLSANTWHIRDCALRGVFAGIALHKREMRPKKTRAVSLGTLGTLGTLGRLKQSRRDSQRTAVDSKH